MPISNVFKYAVVFGYHVQNHSVNVVEYYFHAKRYFNTNSGCLLGLIFIIETEKKNGCKTCNKSPYFSEVKCEEDPPAAPTGTTLVPLKSSPASPDTYAEYTCNDDKELSLVSRCETDGQWSEVAGECPSGEK